MLFRSVEKVVVNRAPDELDGACAPAKVKPPPFGFDPGSANAVRPKPPAKKGPAAVPPLALGPKAPGGATAPMPADPSSSAQPGAEAVGAAGAKSPSAIARYAPLPGFTVEQWNQLQARIGDLTYATTLSVASGPPSCLAPPRPAAISPGGTATLHCPLCGTVLSA